VNKEQELKMNELAEKKWGIGQRSVYKDGYKDGFKAANDHRDHKEICPKCKRTEYLYVSSEGRICNNCFNNS